VTSTVVRVFAKTTEPKAPGWSVPAHQAIDLVVGPPTIGAPTLAIGNIDHLQGGNPNVGSSE
jgi:hypothetical protein